MGHNIKINFSSLTVCKTSSELYIKCGVPQGSIIGPLLFLLYINDLHKVLNCTKYCLYADDTVLYMSDSDVNNAHAGLQHDLNGLNEWCELNRVTINAKKTKLMLFGTNNMLKRARFPNTSIGNNNLLYVKIFNYLGVKLDCKLNFENHAKECLRLVSHKLYMLTKVRSYITNDQALTIYKSKILPYFDYGDIFYLKTHLRTLYKLQKLQNRALKLCLGKHARYGTDLIHTEANVAKLDARRTCHIINFIYYRSRLPQYIRNVDRQLRRYDAPIMIEHVSNNHTFDRSILYQGAIHWNNLPVIERNIENYDIFKSLQKKRLTQGMF